MKVCGNIPKCMKCGAFKINSHVCSGKWCCYCKTEVDFDHKCFITNVVPVSKKTPYKGFIFFDYEEMQSENGHLVCAEKICLSCINGKECKSMCENLHGKQTKIFVAGFFKI